MIITWNKPAGWKAGHFVRHLEQGAKRKSGSQDVSSGTRNKEVIRFP